MKALSLTSLRAMLTAFFVFIGASCTSSPNLFAAVTAAGAGDCRDAANAGTLATCIGLAVPSDTISLMPGTHRTHSLVIPASMNIVGSGIGVSIVDGGGAGRLFTVDAPGGTVSFVDVSLQNGAVAGSGGAVLAEAGIVIFTRTAITGNSATSGGGISCDLCDALIIVSSQLTSNSAELDGGAIDTDGDTTIAGSTISQNRAGVDGGGIHKQRDALVVSGSEITANAADDEGGGIYSAGDSTEITQSALIGNSSLNDGGGISVHGSAAVINELSIVNSTLSENSAASGGAIGIDSPSGLATLINLTLVDNQASPGGADDIESTSPLVSTLSNSIVTHPARGGVNPECGSAGAALSLNGSGNLIDDGTACVGPVGTFNLGALVAGSLGPLAFYGAQTRSYSLVNIVGNNALDNPAIGECLHPTSGVPLDEDQRSSPRPVGIGSLCDIGAYEWL